MVSRKVLALLGIVLVCGTTLAYAQKAAAALTAQDFVEIQQLYAKYNWTLDAGDAEGYASTFTADGVFNNNVGHDAIATMPPVRGSSTTTEPAFATRLRPELSS